MIGPKLFSSKFSNFGTPFDYEGKRKLAEALAAIPNVGKDEDFARIEDAAEARRVPD